MQEYQLTSAIDTQLETIYGCGLIESLGNNFSLFVRIEENSDRVIANSDIHSMSVEDFQTILCPFK